MRTPLGRPSSRRPDRSRFRPAPPPPRPQGPWKAGPIPVVGLVGGIGSGKSLVASMMVDKGAHLLDADAIGHVLLDQPPTRDEVIARFSTDVLDRSAPEGVIAIDRKKLGAIVFADDASRRALETILHPRMRQTFEKAIGRTARKSTAPAIVLDAAVLFETKWQELCDFIVFVNTPAEIRLERVQSSRGWTAENLAARESAQLPLEKKQGRCDFVIENVGDEVKLRLAVDDLWEKLTRRPKPDPARLRVRRPSPPTTKS